MRRLDAAGASRFRTATICFNCNDVILGASALLAPPEYGKHLLAAAGQRSGFRLSCVLEKSCLDTYEAVTVAGGVSASRFWNVRMRQD
jgi:hypothetical protein